MRLPRLTVRRTMILTALIALGCAVASEFRDGLPPRFVVRSLKGRIERLRPGMSHEEVDEILGLKASWLRGGTGATYLMSSGNGQYRSEIFEIGNRRVVEKKFVRVGNRTKPMSFVRSRAAINLLFDTSLGSNLLEDGPMVLRSASADVDGETVVKMSESQ